MSENTEAVFWSLFVFFVGPLFVGVAILTSTDLISAALLALPASFVLYLVIWIGAEYGDSEQKTTSEVMDD